MRAAVLSLCGQPPVVADRPVPRAGAGQVAVTVTAAPITPLDVLCATGTSYFGMPELPYVPGVQGVGTLADGTPVWFPTMAGVRPGDGSMAQTVVVPAADVVALPAGVEHALIAALGTSALAAWSALVDTGGLAGGEQVLVLGAGGVVGQAALQIARLHGARRVVAACRSALAQQRAHRLGADAVVVLRDDDTVGTLAGRLREATDGPVDLVLDPLFGIPAAAALRTLRPHGRLVNLGSAAAETAPVDSATLRGGSLRILGYTNNALSPDRRSATMALVAGHAAAGRLTVHHETVPLADAADAWTRQATGAATSRLVLIP
jgi:NADPH:quinone reductase-like Zn-dependent oxidoreductase